MRIGKSDLVWTLLGIGTLTVLLWFFLAPAKVHMGGTPEGACMINLLQIKLAAEQYAEENHGDHPPSFGALMHAGYGVRPEFFICPASRDCVPGGFPTDPRVASVSVLDRVEEFGSYVMVKGPRRRELRDAIVVYEKPGHHKNGWRYCLLDDGRIERLTEAEFQRRMAAQEASLRGKDAKTDPPK